MRAEIRNFKGKWGARFGIVAIYGIRDAKMTIGSDYGIEQNWGGDDGIDELYWGPSVISRLGEHHWDWC